MKAAELFDEILKISVSYPRTLMLLILGRATHFAESSGSSRCPAGAFVFLTFTAIYVIVHAFPPGIVFKLPEWMTKELGLALVFAVVGVLVNIQAYFLRLFMVEFRSPAVFEIERLAYPYSVAVFVTTIIFLTPFLQRMLYTAALPQVLYAWMVLTVIRGTGLLSCARAILAATISCGVALALAILISLIYILLWHQPSAR